MANVNGLSALTQRERLIVGLALLVAVVFALTRGLPLLVAAYDTRADSIDSVELDIERERRLLDSADLWRDRRAATTETLSTAEAGLFRGATAAVIEASIQRRLTQHAARAGLTVNSTRLAERQQSGDWMLVSQEMSFRTDDAAATVSFLRFVDESVPKLKVSGFTLDRSRSQFSGSITVVGFAKMGAR